METLHWLIVNHYVTTFLFGFVVGVNVMNVMLDILFRRVRRK